jgi:MFS transporter, FHS family, L-fucose permease
MLERIRFMKFSQMFKGTDGKSLFVTFLLVTSLFLLWGFCNGMIDILNKHFQDALHINKEQSGLVQSANYLAYFLMAIPAGLLARKFGYKGGILIGLTLIAGGAFWFVYATSLGVYWAFLLGLFIIAAGMTCLETIANPYATVLGSPEGGATRINIAQTINGCGWILGPIVGGSFVFSAGPGASANVNAGLSTPYLGIGIFVALLLVIFAVSKVPDLHAEDESKKSAEEKNRLKPTSGQLVAIVISVAVVCGLLYFFIAPIVGLIWALLNLPAAMLAPTKYVLIVVTYIIAFLLVSKNWDLFRRKHFTLGIGAQFLYVAAQTGIFSFCVNYIIENAEGVSPKQAAHWLGAIGFVLFTVGRFCGSAVISQFKPHLVLTAYAVINVALTAICMLGGKIGLYAMFGTFFFMSIMFPTIFALGIRGLGNQTKFGSSLIVMSIVGGAIAAPFMGRIADTSSMRLGFVVPLVCFVGVAIYASLWQKLEAKDAGSGDDLKVSLGASH